VLRRAHDSGLCVLQNTHAIVYTSRYLKPTEKINNFTIHLRILEIAFWCLDFFAKFASDIKNLVIMHAKLLTAACAQTVGKTLA
jgi:hypothetical protein